MWYLVIFQAENAAQQGSSETLSPSLVRFGPPGFLQLQWIPRKLVLKQGTLLQISALLVRKRRRMHSE